MKRLLLSALLATLVLAGSTVYAMTADDIIQLCKAGFTPERIAKIVDATGLDEPLAAADWARIRNDGCDDRVVDALLEVLVPVDENSNAGTGETESESSGESSQTSPNINVYLHSNWGWDGWYGGFSYGWNDPFWSLGWTAWDPYWGWSSWGYPNYWYANDWWGYPYSHRFGCGPFFYHSNWYNGGYYSSGHYARYKESRRGSLRNSYYADLKTPQTLQQGLVAKTIAMSTQVSSGSFDRSAGLRSKTAAQPEKSIGTRSTATDRAYTTRSKAGSSTAVPRVTTRSKSQGASPNGKSSTGAERYGTVKARGTTRTSPSTGGTGSEGTNSRPKAKTSRGGEAPAPSVRPKSTPPPSNGDGGKGSVGKDAGTSEGSTQDTPTPRRKR